MARCEFLGAAEEVATELVGFDRAGAQVWTYMELGVNSDLVLGSDDGSVAWDRGYEGGDASSAHLAGAVFGPTGERTELSGWPISAVRDGAVATCDGERCGWEDLATGARATTWEDEAPWQVLIGDQVVFPARSGGRVGVRAESPRGGSFAPLDGARELDDVELIDVEGAFALVRFDERIWRLEVGDALESERVDLTPPSGLRWFEGAGACAALPPTLTESGDLLVALRDDASGALWQTNVAGRTWQQVGNPVTDVLWLTGEAIGEAILVSATSADATFCSALTWAASDALPGSSLQVARSGVVTVVASDDLRFSYFVQPTSDDGRCMLLPTESDTYEVLDVVSQQRSSVPEWGEWLLRR